MPASTANVRIAALSRRCWGQRASSATLLLQHATRDITHELLLRLLLPLPADAPHPPVMPPMMPEAQPAALPHTRSIHRWDCKHAQHPLPPLPACSWQGPDCTASDMHGCCCWSGGCSSRLCCSSSSPCDVLLMRRTAAALGVAPLQCLPLLLLLLLSAAPAPASPSPAAAAAAGWSPCPGQLALLLQRTSGLQGGWGSSHTSPCSSVPPGAAFAFAVALHAQQTPQA